MAKKKFRNKLNFKFLLIFIVVAAFLAYFIFIQFIAKTYISSDTIIKGDYSIEGYKTVVVKNNAKLVVEGDMKLRGVFVCENGSLNLEVRGELVVDGVINCQRDEGTGKNGHDVNGISLVLPGSASFNKNSIIASNSNVQIVESPHELLKTEEEIEKAFDEIAQDSGGNIRIGPFVSGRGNKTSIIQNFSDKEITEESWQTNNHASVSDGFSLVKSAHAQQIRRWIIDGVMFLGDPKKELPKAIGVSKVPRDVELVVILFKMKNGMIELRDGMMVGTDGHDGKDVKGGCDIRIPKTEGDSDKKSKHGFRMRVDARKIKVKNYNLFLGGGGKGGNAETSKNCNPGIAAAGDGGESSNIKWTADEGIEILGKFNIYPGKGGDGGDAKAYGRNGKEGCPGQNGGDAFAIGGKGANFDKTLRAVGNVQGIDKIFIGKIFAGNGGDAQAEPGKGGDGTKCGCAGGRGGAGRVQAGRGGYVSIDYPKGVEHDIWDEPGKDGKQLNRSGLPGKDGPACASISDKKPPVKKDAVGKTPVIEKIDYTELHGSYEETPHRYFLKAAAYDPEGGKLTFVWKINCGYFVGSTNGQQVEWRYNTPGECADAVVTVVARDADGNLSEKTQSVFAY